jgi:hypothetical protein
MSYDAKHQEKFFQTRRIQIGASPLERYARSFKYVVLHRDVIREPQKYVCWYRIVSDNATAGCWSDQIPAPEPRWERHREFGYNKQAALKIAQRETVRLNLPFDPKTDALALDDIDAGPLQACFVCHAMTEHRAHQPIICERCQTAYAAGQIAATERAQYGIEARDLLPYFLSGNEWAMSMDLAEKLLRLAGSQLLDALEYRERGNVARIIRFERDNDRNWVHGAFMTPAQAENFEQVVKFIRDLLDNARAAGQRRGESVLLQLASGDLSVNEFNDRTIHNKNR